MDRQQDIEKNRVIAALGYLGFLCFVPLLTRRSSPYALFHAKQGLLLFLVETTIFFMMLLPLIGWFVWWLGMLGLVGLSLAGYVQALRGVQWPLPVLSRFTKYFDIT